MQNTAIYFSCNKIFTEKSIFSEQQGCLLIENLRHTIYHKILLLL